jgi:hypothetical protein
MARLRARVVIRREPLLDKVCPVCGRKFRGVSKQRYDRPACLRRASYERHAEERRAYQRDYQRRRKAPNTEEGEGNGER